LRQEWERDCQEHFPSVGGTFVCKVGNISARGEQFTMGSHFDDLSAFDDNDAAGMFDGGKPMGDNEYC
jgi:hypothetical protein